MESYIDRSSTQSTSQYFKAAIRDKYLESYMVQVQYEYDYHTILESEIWKHRNSYKVLFYHFRTKP